MRVAGLAPVEDVPGLENMDVTELVDGHMAYRAAMPRLLRELGWSVVGDEFAEIEDPVREIIIDLEGVFFCFFFTKTNEFNRILIIIKSVNGKLSRRLTKLENS